MRVSPIVAYEPYYKYRKFYWKPVRNKYKGKTFKEILNEMLKESSE